jgi:hypothetical protein
MVKERCTRDMNRHPTPVFAAPTPGKHNEPLADHEIAALRPAPSVGQWLASVIRGTPYRGSSTNTRISREVRSR